MRDATSRAAFAIAMLAALMCACGGPAARQASPTDDATAGRATLVAIATAGLLPDGLVIATKTPDLHAANKLSPEQLQDRLAQDPKLARLFAAIAARDVDAVLDQFDWQPLGCGGRLTPPCPPGETPGAPVGAVSAGPDASAARAELRPVVAAMLAAEPTLGFVAQSQREPARFLLAYYAATDAPMPSWGGDPSEVLGGVLLDIDARGAAPVQSLELAPPYPAPLQYAMQRVRDSDAELLMLLIRQY